MSTDLVKVVDINAEVFKLRQTWHIAVRCYITIRLVSADGGVGVMGGGLEVAGLAASIKLATLPTLHMTLQF